MESEFSKNHIFWATINLWKLLLLSRFRAVQAAVIGVTLGLLSAGIYGTCNIKVEFDPFKMLSQDSYLKQFLDTYKNGKKDLT